MIELKIRRWLTHTDRRPAEAANRPDLYRFAVAVVLENPLAGKGYVDDLTPLIRASVDIGRQIGEVARGLMGSDGVQSYGKAGLVGLQGEQEHVNALLTTDFANPIRDAIGGGKAWISSVTKRACPGESIDVPMAHKDAVYVRSHYDALTLRFQDSPAPDEVVLIMAFSNRGRLNARVGGLTHDDVEGLDGLR